MSKTTDINPAEVAKLRREGSTWAQVREATDSKLISTRFAELLSEAGYDRAGVKAGTKQESKAIVKGTNGNGKRGNARKQSKPAAKPSGRKAVNTRVSKSETDASAAKSRAKRARRAGKAAAQK
jgi:hypothetical protein